MEDKPTPSWRRFTKLKPSRKKLRRHARKIESATLKHAHTFIVRRWENVRQVRRFALAWLALVALLIGISGLQMVAYQNHLTKAGPTEGGTFAEGVVGPLETINPLFAATSAERSASRLVFSSLLSYDSMGSLRGEVAAGWRVEDGGKRYIVDLKQDVFWHDGASLTADDVVFTISRIKNPLTHAELGLYNSWVGVKVEKLSDYSVAFELSSAYAPFPHALTFGIIPKHLLNDVKPEALREADFSRNPVGSGPFVFSRLQIIDPATDRVVLYLNANEGFHRGAPKLSRFQLHVYSDSERIKKAFLAREINAATNISSDDLYAVKERMPLSRVSDATIYDGVYALMRTDSFFLKDLAVREALRYGLDRRAVIGDLHGYAKTLEGPLLPEQLPTTTIQRQPSSDKGRAAALLDGAGWKLVDGKRMKADLELKLQIVARKTGDYPTVLESVVKQWRELGVSIEVELAEPDTFTQNVLLPRAYDVLIDELELGADPDVYAYWHSSQASTRLNLSNYSSSVADEALLGAQTRLDFSLRRLKYETFIDTWLKDVPAIALYQPTLHYVTTESVRTFPGGSTLPDSESRFRNVEDWTVEQGVFYNTP